MQNNNQVIQIDIDPNFIKKLSFMGLIHKIFGVLAVISGSLMCLGIVTAIMGIPYLISGIKLYKSGSQFSYAAYSNDGKFIKEALLNLASFWMFNLIAIALTIISYIIFMVIIVFILSYNRYY